MLTLAILTLTWLFSEAAVQCPPPEEIAPCKCQQNQTLKCHNMTDQSQLKTLMDAVHRLNPGDMLEFYDFEFINLPSNVTSLDLTPLTRSNMTSLYIQKNEGLTTIERSKVSDKMMVKDIQIVNVPLTNEAIGNLLSFINPDTGPVYLNVTNSSNFGNVPPGSPLIRDLTSHNKLTQLTLEHNQVEDLNDGAFTGPNSLAFISLDHNKIKKVATGAFKIDRRDQKTPLRVELNHNKLVIDKTTNSFEAGFVAKEINGNKSRYQFSMEHNELEFLPKDIFKKLVYDQLSLGGPISRMWLQGNPFVCDERMDWLKCIKNPERIDGVNCTNDPDKTIFTTKKVKMPECKDEDAEAGDGGAATMVVGPVSSLSLVFVVSVNFLGLMSNISDR